MPNQRQQLSEEDLNNAANSVYAKTIMRAGQKGFGSMASNHEILGIIQQETSEYEDAVHKRHSDEEKIEELKDIAVACIFGIASIKTGGIDW